MEDLTDFRAKRDEFVVFIVGVRRIEVLGDVFGGEVVDFAGVDAPLYNGGG